MIATEPVSSSFLAEHLATEAPPTGALADHFAAALSKLGGGPIFSSAGA